MKLASITFWSLAFSYWIDKPWFLTEGKTCYCAHDTFLLGFPTGWLSCPHHPSTNGNGYGNSYGNSSNNTRGVPSELELMLKDFISKQTAFNKSVEEKLRKIDILASKVDSLALDVELLKLKVLPHDVK
jgi:hypothetical protein